MQQVWSQCRKLSLWTKSIPSLLGVHQARSVAERLSETTGYEYRSVQTTAYNVGESTNIKWHESMVTRDDKEKLLKQKGCVLWFTGLSGSGKSTVACTLEHTLNKLGKFTINLDGDNIRHGLNKNLGFTPEDREENIRRIGEVAKLFAENGTLTLVSFISPYRADRDKVRARLAADDFIEVYMKIPIEVCESRDPKGLYKAARAGKIKGFTGIDDPYEEPLNPEITVEVKDEGGNMTSPEVMAQKILSYLDSKGYLK
uniref:Adenylyl-sulfate kinase n=1 Tax=Tetraselmis sp. GSL018 TaxID=582737 RepID=A0A061RXC0_9CHLO|mmetsp:Transcript_21588/g.51552  ORF Transcript_21588/g.51552 Transcript_21588/m.51552 type:complete len:257 (-) Transcript_21588:948-1718(-)|eukprot:CAMPEP_0177616082 /NCGR_PEP_ID=MMETSP0419_2-20121207/23907_1 /TAXON_ID=582737 /ORGANISM="Tetraselmis sp., Strain GSL018" /LENGTH=256 /DNA_ID=CAMNT_0019113999 /DNA_START=79 /DNA_END=849 /DNA_ORIENTATION=+